MPLNLASLVLARPMETGEADTEQSDQQSAHPCGNAHHLKGAIDNLHDDERHPAIECRHPRSVLQKQQFMRPT